MDTTWWPELAEGIPVKHQAIKRSIQQAVGTGRIEPGTRLPPVREVAWRLGVTPGTVARAYKDLVDQGVLSAMVGRGTFVAVPETPAPLPALLDHLGPGRDGTMLNLRTAHVADVGQGAMLHSLLKSLPDPGPGAYVTYPGPEHDLRLRELLAGWFAAPGHGIIAPEDVVLTAGAQHGMVVLLQSLLHGPRPVVLTEELAYPGFRHAAALVRAEINGISFDGEGLLPDALARACRETGAQVLCTSPEAHNPTTIRTSPERRAQIVSVCREYNLQIIDDDCFRAEGGEDASYRRLAPERSWVVTTLSKTLSPDLRLGAILAAPGQGGRARLAAQQQFFGLSRPTVALAEAALSSGVADRVRDAVLAVQARRVAMARDRLGGFALRLRDGVPFAWLEMPRGWRPSSLSGAAEARGVRIKPADEFALIDGRAPSAVRLALTGERDDAAFAAGLDRLAELLAAPRQEVEV
ncbi:PLP-dependent aminotransferase family protein [Limimaricola pyoseonensis]|uniref:DNA-binding transcriptional regulator, MocR family, contains an aminotransferase domain n=1 Tax=Limimaricola pyoseonensis TaxID=521013 RepID=A0A1G7AGI4_9RHOB|nr:PLP-dependent aminotransferase family protein [Limimaricola pyoseonensis]SDE13909.1 DNA-binding transcriptional regulator, MocR family, contains an aminotransferase domain [Limimaricola pyoseonensis]